MRQAEAFASSQGWPAKQTYALLLDADAVLECDAKRVRAAIQTAPNTCAFYCTHVLNTHQYARLNMLCMTNEWVCVGAAHENWEPRKPTPFGDLKDQMLVHELNTGGTRSSKARREITLLETDYATNPGNSRTLFYLGRAHTYGGDEGNAARGLQLLKKRIAHPNFREEAFEARIIVCDDARATHDSSMLLSHAMLGLADAPTRPELLYAAATALRRRDAAHIAACELLLLAIQRSLPPSGSSDGDTSLRAAWIVCAAAVAHPGVHLCDVERVYAARRGSARLFVCEDVVRFGLFDELAINATWTDTEGAFKKRGKLCNDFLMVWGPENKRSAARDRVHWFA
jgi:hypothetical protein